MNPQGRLQKIPQNEIDWFDALIRLARYLRGPEGCPWDRKQRSKDFGRFCLDEAHELAEAFAHQDFSHVEEEWGDTLFTLLATMAALEEEGRSSLARALKRIHEKMVRRHGHIFGDHVAETPEDAAAVWNRIKAEERGAIQPPREDKKSGNH